MNTVASDAPEDCQISAYQGSREILRSGVLLVTPGSAPLVVSVGDDVRSIHFDLVPEFRRADGVIVAGSHDIYSIAPDESKMISIGNARLTYSLENHRPDRTGLDPAGRPIPAICLLVWELWRPRSGVPAPPPMLPNFAIASRDPSCLV